MVPMESSRALEEDEKVGDSPSTWDVFRSRSELDKCRRTLSELVTRMDRFVSSQAVGLKGLFRPEMEMYRLKLGETALKLLEMDPSGWGMKAFDLHWHKAFHSSLKYALKKRGQLDEEERARLQGLIWRAVSHYQGILDALEAKKKDERGGKIPSFAPSQQESSFVREESGLDIKCLLYLGDLARYCREIDPSPLENHYWRISRQYYAQALHASDYKAGMPYNQLGRLAENTYWGLPSAYYYLRSTLSEDAFPGAEVNLRHLLAKNEKVYMRCMEVPPSEDMETFVVSLLHVSQMSLLESETKTSELSETYQNVLTLFYLKIVKDLQKEDSQVSSNAVALLLATLQYMESQKKESTKPSFISLGRAALLAFFSHCVFKLLVDLKMDLFGSEDIEDEEEDENDDDSQDKTNETLERSPSMELKKENRNILDRFRRKRNRFTSSTDDNDSEEDSIISEDASFSNSISSDEEQEEFVLSRSNFMDSSDSEEDSEDEKVEGDDIEEEDVIIQQSSVVCSSKDLAKTLGSHSLVPSIRLLCLWVMGTPEVVTQGDEHSKIFWERLNRVFNLIDFQCSSKYIENEDINAKWYKLDNKSPMAEDYLTKGLKILSNYHSTKLDWDRGLQSFENADLGLVRIKQLLEFRDWLLEVKKSDICSNVQKSTEDNSEEVKKHALMQNMAQLWLKQEVANLEEKDSKIFSPYIIVDHFAMVKHLRTIKDIVAAKKFTLVIPNAVVEELDSMKRTNNGARVAIRWLEWQFKQGNPWLRAQKKYESTPLEDIEYPKRKNKEAWHYFEILECCNYFTSLGSTRTVTLLSPQDVQMDVKPTELAKCIGIRIEHVKAFRHCLKRNKDRDG